MTAHVCAAPTEVLEGAGGVLFAFDTRRDTSGWAARFDAARGVPVHIDAGPWGYEALDALFHAAGGGVCGHLWLDPWAQWARDGGLMASWESTLDQLASRFERCDARGTQVTPLAVDTTVYHHAGATDADALGWGLAGFLSVLAAMEARGVPASTVFQGTALRVAVNQAPLAGAASVRAARLLWSRLGELLGARPHASPVHAVAAERMWTVTEPWANVLRVTGAASGASLGGADSFLVRGAAETLPLPVADAHRVIFQSQLVVAHETALGRGDDLMGGSGHLEALTEALCADAWAEAQRYEGPSAFREALVSGALAARVARNRHQVAEALASGQLKRLGINAFVESRVPPSVPTPRLAGLAHGVLDESLSPVQWEALYHA